MKKKIYNEAMKLYNELANLGVYTSYHSILNTMYESSTEKKHYEKANIIMELINDEIEGIGYSQYN